MSTQKNVSAKTPTLRKLHSIHALPHGRDFNGQIELGQSRYRFAFAPESAALANRKLVLTGSVTVSSPSRQKRTADRVEATLLATQGSAASAPPFPRALDPSLKTPNTEPLSLISITDATGNIGSVGVMYLKLSELNGKTLGVPLDLSGVQLNVRLYPTSEIERDLQWLYSALVRVTLGESPDEQQASLFLAELNGIFKTGRL
ncbi:MAG TPA: hypothetical protein VJ302_03825 [Blastocatellia bacterium]|nr:hypothetical protein [Blastocatellia bacterium]